MLEETSQKLQDQLLAVGTAWEKERLAHRDSRELLESHQMTVAEKEAALRSSMVQLDKLKEEVEAQRRAIQDQDVSWRDHLQAEVDKRDQRVASLEEQLASVQRELSLSAQRIANEQSLKSTLQSTLDRAKESEARLQGDLADLRGSYNIAQLSLQQSSAEKDGAEERAICLARQLETVKAEHEAAQQHWQQMMKDRERRLDAVGKQSVSVSVLETRIFELQEELQQMSTICDAGNAERQHLMTALKEESDLLASTATTLADIQGKLLEKDELLSAKNREIAELRLELFSSASMQGKPGDSFTDNAVNLELKSIDRDRGNGAVYGSGVKNGAPATGFDNCKYGERGGDNSSGDLGSTANDADFLTCALDASLERENYEARLQHIQAELTEKTQELLLQQQLNREHEERMRALSQELSACRSHNNELALSLTSIEAQLSETQVHLALQRTETAEMKLMYEQGVKKLHMARAEGQKAMDETRLQSRVHREEMSALSERIHQLSLRLAELHNDHSVVLSKLGATESQLAAAQATNDALRERLSTSDTNEDVAIKEISHLKETVAQLSSSLSANESEHAKKIQLLQHERDTGIYELQAKNSGLALEIEDLRQMNAQMELRLEEEEQSKSNELASLQGLLKEKIQLYDIAVNRATQLEQTLRALQGENERLSGEISLLHEKCRQCEDQLEQGRQLSERYHQLLQQCEEEKKTIQAKFQAAEQRHRSEKATLESTSVELRQLLRDRSALDTLRRSAAAESGISSLL